MSSLSPYQGHPRRALISFVPPHQLPSQNSSAATMTLGLKLVAHKSHHGLLEQQHVQHLFELQIRSQPSQTAFIDVIKLILEPMRKAPAGGICREVAAPSTFIPRNISLGQRLEFPYLGRRSEYGGEKVPLRRRRSSRHTILA